MEIEGLVQEPKLKSLPPVLELLEKLREFEGFMEMSTKCRWGYDIVTISFKRGVSSDTIPSKVSIIDFAIGFINNRRVNIDYFNGDGRKWKMKLTIPRNQICSDISDGL